MLSFLVFDGDAPALRREVRHAHLLGQDAIPVAGEVAFEKGLVVCRKTTPESAALAMQVELDEKALRRVATVDAPSARGIGVPELKPLGHLTLRTCLLPDRDQPYLLNLELARARIMLFLNALEEWQLTDLPSDAPLMRLFESARLTFTDALVAQRHGATPQTFGFSPEADRLAMRALWLAIDAGERLTLHAAARDFADRAAGRIYERTIEASPDIRHTVNDRPVPVVTSHRTGVVIPGRPGVGCAVSPQLFAEPLQNALPGTVDFITMPVRWVDMEPQEGEYSFEKTDRWIEWAVRKARLPVAAGPVIDFRPGNVPDWVYIWENDYETLRELVYEHLRAVITRYRRTVQRWVVTSGLHVSSNFNLNFDQMMDLTRISVLTAKKLHPQARVYVELTQPWGEFYTHDRKSLPPMLYAEMINQAGIPVDGFGLRVQMGGAEPGQSARDLMEFSAMLDRYAALDRPIGLTGVGCPSVPIDPSGRAAGENGAVQPAGYWRAPWNPTVQADWLTSALAVALSKPYVDHVVWQELADGPKMREMPSGGLLTGAGDPKPAVARLRELRAAASQKTTPESLKQHQRL